MMRVKTKEKKDYYLLVLSLFVLFLLLFFSFGRSNPQFVFYKISGKRYKLLVAKNRQEWERGLMFYKSLPYADGMIFIFPQREIRSFWNKNTHLNLEIYWIDRKKVVGKNFLPSVDQAGKIVSITSPSEVDKVVEIKR